MEKFEYGAKKRQTKRLLQRQLKHNRGSIGKPTFGKLSMHRSDS